MAADHPVQMAVQRRLDRVLALVEAGLGEAEYLAGSEFTAADIMSVFSLNYDAAFSAAGSSAVSQYPGLSAADRRAASLRPGDGKE